MQREYDIGHGCIIIDDGHTIRADWSEGVAHHSIGIKRPPLGSIPDELDIQYSIGRLYFYLPRYSGAHGFWLGTKKWPSKDEMQTQQLEGLFGKEGVELTIKSTGEKYCREMMSFVSWSVKAERNYDKIKLDEEMVKDYLSLAQDKDRESEKRFNDAIAFTGRTLAWIMGKIGEWPPVPPKPPLIVLED